MERPSGNQTPARFYFYVIVLVLAAFGNGHDEEGRFAHGDGLPPRLSVARTVLHRCFDQQPRGTLGDRPASQVRRYTKIEAARSSQIWRIKSSFWRPTRTVRR